MGDRAELTGKRKNRKRAGPPLPVRSAVCGGAASGLVTPVLSALSAAASLALSFLAAPTSLALFLLAAPTPAEAQLRGGVRGYVLNVGGYAGETAAAPDGFFDLQRLRVMTRPTFGPLTFDAAYEHTLDLRSAGAGEGLVEGIGGLRPVGDWLDLDGTIRETGRLRWTHRLDRLNVAATLPGDVRLRVGRQTISWASTLLLTPGDPFAPFDPADPFREFRGGVDALRLQHFPGPFTELDFVLRPVKGNAEGGGGGTTLTALGRWQGLVRGWEVSGWGGALHEAAAFGAGAVGAVGALALRSELSLRRAGSSWVLRGAAGADGRREVTGRDLFLSAEIRYDGFGAGDGERLGPVLLSEPFRRGELQLLGRWVAAGTASFQLHPLVTPDLLVLTSLGDGSVLLGPGLAWSVSDEVSLRLGGFVGLGPSRLVPPPSAGQFVPADALVPESEFGLAPSTFYAAVSAFF